jgi:KaiC/GvpD/RAD55 family RecA-like ATPase
LIDFGDSLTKANPQSEAVSGTFDDARMPIGVEALDRQLEGGLRPGSVVAYLAPPASQSELLLMEMTNERDSLYLSTARSEAAVRDAFDRCVGPTGDPVVEHIPGDAPIDDARQLLMSVDEPANLIIDPVDALERGGASRYQKFLNDLQNHMQNTGSVAVLHALSGQNRPDLRSVTEYMADVVFDLRLVFEGTEVETRLAVPKFRGGRALDETIKLELEDRVRVDTSRDIA